MKAKRGDLVVIERLSSYTTTTDGRHEHTKYEVGMVTSTTREGIVKAAYFGNGSPTLLKNMGHIEGTYVIGADDIDVTGATHAAWANPWPHNGMPGMPFDSLDDVKKTLKPHKITAT